MREFFTSYGCDERTIQILESWISWLTQQHGQQVTPFAHAIMDAIRQAREGGPPASMPQIQGSPLINAPPPSMPQVPGMAPVTATFGRSPKGQTPAPLPQAGPPPPNVQISPAGIPASGARVQITPAPGATIFPAAAGGYTGDLQPGQQRVEITLPDGTIQPPILVDKDHRVLTPLPGALPVAAGPLAAPVPVAVAAAPGTLAGAMESVKIAGQLGPKQLDAMRAIQRGDETPLSSVLIALGLVELKDGELVLSEGGRTALALAEVKIARDAAAAATVAATLAPPPPSEAP